MSKKNYFDTEALATHPPIAAPQARTPLVPDAQHAQRPTRTVMPVVAFGAFVMLLFVGTFALGFYTGSKFNQPEPSKIAGPAFTHQPAKFAGKPFVKMPEELP